MFTLRMINCDSKLKKIGIDMNEIGSGAKLDSELIKTILYVNWEYVYVEDNLNIFCEDNTVIPDMSIFGEILEVLPYDNTVG